MEHNSFSVRIKEIIAKRNPLAARVTAASEKLGLILGELGRLRRECAAALENEKVASHFKCLDDVCARSADLLKEIETRKNELLRIGKRLSRENDTLNIAVLGLARQGKSQLLRTITGLGIREIPTGDGSFCTGVRSDIINEPGLKEAYAYIHFYTEKEFIDEKVRLYFDQLSKVDPSLRCPETASEFKNYQLPARGELKDDRAQTATDMNLENLRQLQNFPMNFLNHEPKRIEANEIREYVAQDDSEGNRKFFNYTVVKKAEIHCAFPNSDVGSLRLIDLPGLGDTQLGDDVRMMNALKEDADFAFFVCMPKASGDGLGEAHVRLHDTARSALGVDLPIERWSFWVLNHNSRDGDNANNCSSIAQAINGKDIAGARAPIIADCSNSEEVSEKILGAVMELLSNELEKNDELYTENVRRKLHDTISDVSILVEDAEDMAHLNNSGESDDAKISDLFDDIWTDLRPSIQRSVDEKSPLRMKRDEPCEALQSEVEKILESELQHISEETQEDSDLFLSVEKKKASEGDYPSAYAELLHIYRTRLSGNMQKDLDAILEDVIDTTKDDICNILIENGKLGMKQEWAIREGERPNRLLKHIIDFIDSDEDRKRNMEDIYKGLEMLYTWKMSYRNFIQHRLRRALNSLDPLDAKCLKLEGEVSAQRAVELLKDNYETAIATIREDMLPIYPEPNRAAFAVAEDFKDRVIRQNAGSRKIAGQWRALYFSIKGDIWPEEFGGTQLISDTAEKLNRLVSSLKPLCRTSAFEFLRSHR